MLSAARFEEEEGQAVLYCYELQVLRTAQSRGLGRMLVELSEQIVGVGGGVSVATFVGHNSGVFAQRQWLGAASEVDDSQTSDPGCLSWAFASYGPWTHLQGPGYFTSVAPLRP